MSSPLAIGAVSAVLRNLLDNGIVDVGVPIGSVGVSAVAPDTIDLNDTNSTPSLNVFMYRTSRNIGWENAAFPARNSRGEPISNQPLALNLHYLVTAYGDNDFEAEILLGYAMQLLHERPVLDRPAIRRALGPATLDASILPPAFQALSVSDLAEQIESITVTQEPIDSEEMSRLWSAFQSNYRPTAAYVVTVVLIETRSPVSSGLPVLSRGPVDPVTNRERGVVVTPGLVPPYPTIETARAPDRNPAAVLGDTITLRGHHLDGTAVNVRFEHRLLDPPNVIVVGANTEPGEIAVTLPIGPAAEQDWPAGLYTVLVDMIRPGEIDPRTSNIAPLLLAPQAVLPPTLVTRDAVTRDLSVTLSIRPQLRPEQEATLSLGSHSASVEPHPAVTSSVDFEFGEVPAGGQWVRLGVDGVESLLVDHTSEPAVFDPTQTVAVPA
jgi:hypothetical protein